MLKLFHRHKWEVTNIGLSGSVRVCKCGKFQTLLSDRSGGGSRWVDGLFAPRSTKVVVFAGNHSQYRVI